MSAMTEEDKKLMVETRDGQLVDFDKTKIEQAIGKAAMAAGKSEQYVRESVNGIADEIVSDIAERFVDFNPNVENIHDIVEKHLMRKSLFEVAKAYILHRAEKRRADFEDRKSFSFLRKLTVQKADGRKAAFNPNKVISAIDRLSHGLKAIDAKMIFEETVKTIYDGIKSDEIDKAMSLAAVSFIERDPEYNVLAARLYLQKIKKEVIGHSTRYGSKASDEAYRESFVSAINRGVKSKVFDERMLDFDLGKLADHMVLDRDGLFRFMGIQTLYERYFAKVDGVRIELPQTFWMRVAMGLCFHEEKKTERAIEFYEVMSKLLYCPSTPTLFHSGLIHPQLSSCYINTVDDDLRSIFKTYDNNAQLSKWSGGIGTDWTPIRATGAIVKGPQIESQGVIPYLKISNDVTVAINRSGKRRGATVAYLEVWHLDIEDFLDLKRNTGDERRRAHDMNTALWIPDLFMKRVREDGEWVLFSPDETPDLHETYGKKFEELYESYERKVKRGKIKKHKTIEAKKLYRKMVGMLFETGNNWMCWKDVSNIRSPQDHVGVIHSSNLCTEILLNNRATKISSDGEVISLGECATCNIGSINVGMHIADKKINKALLASTVHTAMRMLDNVIEINYYPIPESKHANMLHRPVGLGIMGYQDALYKVGIDFEDSEDFADELQEIIAFEAISVSCELAVERGPYSSFKGSKWDRGIFPHDTLDLLEQERGDKISVNRKTRLDWTSLKKKVKQHGLRNSLTQAIAPTATISTIVNCFPCIEPPYKNIYVKANMSGEFTVVNEFLVTDLKKLGLWNKDILDQIKFHDGSLRNVPGIPDDVKRKFKEAFEIDPKKAIDITAVRGKWIDQSQSHNIFYRGTSGKDIGDIYEYAFAKGLKTTYYLRTLAASQVEKATLDTKFGFTQKRQAEEPVKMCRLDDPNCEACQ
jgi:ribonucleoside-diphosphate reductase alpha chain